jgi:hypothetical protein
MINRIRQSYTFVVMFLAFVVLAGGGYLYTNHVQQQADHQWCQILVIASRPLPAKPVPTADQIKGRQLLLELAKKKGCI